MQQSLLFVGCLGAMLCVTCKHGLQLVLCELLGMCAFIVKMEATAVCRQGYDNSAKMGKWLWKLRSSVSSREVFPGLAYTLLLPVSVILSTLHLDKTDVYTGFLQTFALSQALVAVFVIAQIHRCVARGYQTRQDPATRSDCAHVAEVPLTAIASVLPMVTVQLVVHVVTYSLHWSTACLELGGIVLQCLVQCGLPIWLPKSFSVGEAAICSQGIVLFLMQAISNIGHQIGLLFPQSAILENAQTSTSFSQVAVLSCGLVVCILYGCSLGPYSLYPVLTLVAAGCALPASFLLLHQDFVTWTLSYITQSHTKVFLFAYWAACCVGALAIVLVDSYVASKVKVSPAHFSAPPAKPSGTGSSEAKAISTRTRKHFHVLAICAFTPGLWLDAEMLGVATSCVLVIFVMLECIRILRTPPVGGWLEQHLSLFVDHQDEGPVILTHIYLLIGCSAPLWLFPTPGEPHLALYAGVISLGVGDTAASVIGSVYGKHNWSGTRKTVEGTVAAATAQFVAVALILSLGLCPSLWWIRIVIAVLMTSLLEAFTTEIDNIVLPLFMYMLLV